MEKSFQKHYNEAVQALPEPSKEIKDKDLETIEVENKKLKKKIKELEKFQTRQGCNKFR